MKGEPVVRGELRPQLRLDVRIQRGVGSLLIVDPATGAQFSFSGTECLIAQAMDGSNTVDDLTRLVRSLNPEATRQQVEQLVARFIDAGLLANVAPGASIADFDQFHRELIDELGKGLDFERFTRETGQVFFDPPTEPAMPAMSQAAGGEPEPAPEATPEPAPAPPATETPASVEREVDEAWQRTRRVRFYQRTSVRLVAALTLLVTVAALVKYPLYVTAECTIVPAERTYVRSLMEGILSSIPVDEGTHVRKGDVVARLDDRQLLADKQRASAELDRIRADLDRLLHGNRREEIQRQRAIAAARANDLKFARAELARRTSLLSGGVGSQAEYDDARRDLALKQNALSEAEAAVRLLLAGSRPEEVAAKEAELKRAESQLRFVEMKLSDMVVLRAPIDGVVITPKFRERLHERVEAGGMVCEIADTRVVNAEILVPEREVDVVAPQMPVTVKVDSYPLQAFSGKVAFLGAVVQKQGAGGYIRVVTALDNSDGLLKSDMTGYGEVRCGRRSLLDLATRRVLRWVRVRFLL